MEFEEIRVITMYISNRVDERKFVELMMPRYNDERYIKRLWNNFRDNPIMFIVARNEVELLELIQKEISDTNYKG